MNRCIIVGRITKDLELKETKKGTKVCEFTLATNRPMDREKADFINVIVWDKQAENLCKYQKKGNLIAVFGEIRTDSYEVEGKKRYKTYVLCNQLEYLSKYESGNQQVLDKEFENTSIKTEFQVGEQIQIEESDLPW